MGIKSKLLLILIIVGLSIRYLPQVLCDINNRNKEILVCSKSITKAWHFWVLYSLILFGCLFIPYNYIDSIFLWLLGLILFISGILIGLLGLLRLNKSGNYSEEILCYKNGLLVTEGIYRFVRHPMRVGLFTELLGMVLMMRQLLLIPPLIIILVLQYWRTKEEEKMLKQIFGSKACEYMLVTPKFNLIFGLYNVVQQHWKTSDIGLFSFFKSPRKPRASEESPRGV